MYINMLYTALNLLKKGKKAEKREKSEFKGQWG